MNVMDMQKQTHHSSRELDVAKIYLYAKDRNKVKHQILVNKQKNSGLKCVNNSKALIEY